MTDLQLLITLVLTVAAVVFGLFAPRPRFRVPDQVINDVGIAAAVAGGLGLLAWVAGALDLAVVGLSLAIIVLFVDVWLATGNPRGGGGGGGWGRGGDGPPRPQPRSPVDWQAFDRDRDRWERETRIPG